MVPRVAEILRRAAQQPAWRTNAGFVSFAGLEQRIRRCAFYLRSKGAKPGEHWAVHGCSALDTFCLALAGMWQGVTLHLLPERLTEGQQALMLKQVPLQGSLGPCTDWPEAALEGPIDWQADTPAVGIFSSGSTGTPKSIVHSWKSLVSSALASNQFYAVQAGDAWLLSLDLAHIGGLQIAIRCFLAGAVCWHLAEPKAIAAVLREECPAFLSLVPTQLYRLLDDQQACRNMQQSKAMIVGGAAASSELVDEALQRGLPLSISYGSSETAAQCSALPPGERPRHPGDVGNLLPGWEYQHTGETLRLRGPAAYLGYFNQGQWHQSTDAAGWMTLPDRILCEQGRLTVLGRRDGIFQVAGENVAPSAIASVLENLRRNADFLLVPCPDPEYGAIPALIVRSPSQPALAPILERLGHLSGVQRPRLIYWHQSDETGKLSRSFYEQALQQSQLPLLWRHESGRV